MTGFILAFAITSGVVTGCAYALVALSFVIINKATGVVNFAGGEMVMVGGYLCMLGMLVFGLPYALAFILVPLAMFVFGSLFDQAVLTKVIGRNAGKEHTLIAAVIATVGLSYALRGTVRLFKYTQEARALPSLVPGPPVMLFGIPLQRQDIAIVVITIVVMMGLWAFFQFTLPGKALRATSQNVRAAALVGIPVRVMRMTVWGIAAGIASIAGMLLAPKLLITPEMGSILMMGFAAAIIGGFTNLPGTIVGGILLGVIQNLVGLFVSANAITVTPFLLIMLVLIVRPQGLFGGPVQVKKV